MTATRTRTPGPSPASSPTPRPCSPTSWAGSAPETGNASVTYNYPQRLERSLRWVALHTLHEVRHHVADVRRQIDEGPDGA